MSLERHWSEKIPAPMKKRVRSLFLKRFEGCLEESTPDIHIEKRFKSYSGRKLIYPVGFGEHLGLAVLLQFSSKHSGFTLEVGFSPDQLYATEVLSYEQYPSPEEFSLHPNQLTQPRPPGENIQIWWNLSNRWLNEPEEVQISRIPEVVDDAVNYLKNVALPFLKATEAAYLKRLDAENSAHGGSETPD